MADAWPPSIPFKAHNGVWTENWTESYGEFAVDDGPPKRRRKYADPGDVCSVRTILDSTQRTDFETFYKTTLKRGTLNFTVDHPITAASTDWQFVGSVTLVYTNTKFICDFQVRRLT